jgi:hypothetical protein
MTEQQMMQLALKLSLDDNQEASDENHPPNRARRCKAGDTSTPKAKAPIVHKSKSKPKSKRTASSETKKYRTLDRIFTTHASGRRCKVQWAPGVIDPPSSRMRLHRRARGLSDAAVEAAEQAEMAANTRPRRSTRKVEQFQAIPSNEDSRQRLSDRSNVVEASDAGGDQQMQNGIDAVGKKKKTVSKKALAVKDLAEPTRRPKRTTKQVERFEAVPSTVDSKQIRQIQQPNAQQDECMVDMPIARAKPKAKPSNVVNTAALAKSKAKSKQAAERPQEAAADGGEGPIVLTDIPDAEVRMLRADRLTSNGRAGGLPFEVGTTSHAPHAHVYVPFVRDIDVVERGQSTTSGKSESEDSEEEDDSDEAYARRHYWREVEEQQLLLKGKFEQRHWTQCGHCCKWRKSVRKNETDKTTTAQVFFCGGSNNTRNDAACNELCSWLVEGVGLPVATAFAEAGLHNLDQLRIDGMADEGIEAYETQPLLARDDALALVEGAGFSYNPISEQIAATEMSPLARVKPLGAL